MTPSFNAPPVPATFLQRCRQFLQASSASGTPVMVVTVCRHGLALATHAGNTVPGRITVCLQIQASTGLLHSGQ
jgi:hypothetical protein